VWTVDAIAHGVPANVAHLVSGWEKLRIDWRVFGFTLLVSLVTGVVFGLAPALLATRTHLNEALKEGGRTGTTVGGRGRLRALLMISEVALSLVLLVGAGLMVRSFISLLKVQPGFNGQNVVTMSISLPFRKYTKPEQSADFYAQLLARVRGLPGVQHAAAVNVIPFEFNDDSTHFQIEGRAPFAPGSEPFADFRVITPDYFNALDIPPVAGTRLQRPRHSERAARRDHQRQDGTPFLRRPEPSGAAPTLRRQRLRDRRRRRRRALQEFHRRAARRTAASGHLRATRAAWLISWAVGRRARRRRSGRPDRSSAHRGAGA